MPSSSPPTTPLPYSDSEFTTAERELLIKKVEEAITTGRRDASLPLQVAREIVRDVLLQYRPDLFIIRLDSGKRDTARIILVRTLKYLHDYFRTPRSDIAKAVRDEMNAYQTRWIGEQALAAVKRENRADAGTA